MNLNDDIQYIKDFEYIKFYKEKSYKYFEPLILLFNKKDKDNYPLEIFPEDFLKYLSINNNFISNNTVTCNLNYNIDSSSDSLNVINQKIIKIAKQTKEDL